MERDMDTGKNYKVWKFDTAAICKATGYSRDRVRRDFWGKKFDPTDLYSVSCYVVSARLAGIAGEKPAAKDDKSGDATGYKKPWTCLDYSNSQERRNPFDLTGEPAKPRSDVPF
jgi:hypothetical protein